MEQEKQIARGEIKKDMCVENNLSWFEQRYSELERSLTRDRVNEFGGALMKTQEYLRYLRRLDAFEPKIDKPNKGHEPRNDTKKRSNTFSTKTGRKGKGRPNLKSQPQKKYERANLFSTSLPSLHIAHWLVRLSLGSLVLGCLVLRCLTSEYTRVWF
jgi:hypothetical protein